MGLPLNSLYGVYLDELSDMLLDRGIQVPDPRFGVGRLGLAGAAVQLAVSCRFSGRDGGERLALASVDALCRAAAAAKVPPDGRRAAVSAQQIETILRQPVMAGDRLGPLSAASARSIGAAIRGMNMVGPTAVFPVMRTIEMGTLRHAQAPQEGAAAHADVVIFAAASHENGGTGIVLLTHHGLDLRHDPSGVRHAAQREPDTVDPDGVRLRVIRLAAIRRELISVSRSDVLIVLRAERRFARGNEGSATAANLWYAAEQPHWIRTADTYLSDAVVLAEVPPDWLRNCTYSLDGGGRRLGSLSRFFSDVEQRDESVRAWSLLMTEHREEQSIEGADDVVVLDGSMIPPGGDHFTPVLVPCGAESTVYLVPRKRALTFGDKDWDTMRRGLASLHGAAAARSSADQGLALTEPFRHGVSFSSPDFDIACNLDLLRAFSHAVESKRHWLDGGPPTAGRTHEHRKAG